MEFKILRTLRADQTTNPINSFGDGIIKIVDDQNPKAFIEKLNHSVKTNETGSSTAWATELSRLSMIETLKPSLRSWTRVWEPMKLAPPITRIVFSKKVIFNSKYKEQVVQIICSNLIYPTHTSNSKKQDVIPFPKYPNPSPKLYYWREGKISMERMWEKTRENTINSLQSSTR